MEIPICSSGNAEKKRENCQMKSSILTQIKRPDNTLHLMMAEKQLIKRVKKKGFENKIKM